MRTMSLHVSLVNPREQRASLPDHPVAETSLPSPEAVRLQLQVILASRPFVTAVRARRFLTYIVEQTLAGSIDGIKELVLGIEVFDRPADFDPKVDTIVRVEAGRLRKRLQEYYGGEGVGAPVLIEVGPGSYVPVFTRRAEPAAEEAPVPTARPWFLSRSTVIAAIALVMAVAGAWWLARRYGA